MDTKDQSVQKALDSVNDKIKMTNHLLNSSANVYTALKTLATLESKRAEQFSIIIAFLNSFYNENCYQKSFIEDLIGCISIEIERINQQV